MILNKAIFGAGCFWSVEEAFRQHTGVVSTRAGYAGGDTENPTYEEVCSGKTNHSEVVEVTFDTLRTSYSSLLDLFFTVHNPFSGFRVEKLIKRQYLSLIIYFSKAQKDEALKKISEISEAQGRPSTELMAYSAFHPAEERHQHYALKQDRFRQGTNEHPQ